MSYLNGRLACVLLCSAFFKTYGNNYTKTKLLGVLSLSYFLPLVVSRNLATRFLGLLGVFKIPLFLATYVGLDPLKRLLSFAFVLFSHASSHFF